MEQESEILYQIGEAIITEIKIVKDIFYPKLPKNQIIILLENGKKYSMILNEIN